MIKVLVVDDHELVRMGICSILQSYPDIEVVGQAETGEMALVFLKQHDVDVVLLDVNMPGVGGVETTRRIVQYDAQCKVIAVSGMTEEPYPSMILKAGAKGYLTKGCEPNEMLKAIQKVMQGGKYLCSVVAEQLASSLLSEHQQSPFEQLSERELQVAMMVANGISAQEIADKLFVSVKTINTYRYRIFEKLDVDSDVKLTHLAIRHKLIQI
ncbi:response regulator [Moraxella sp. ZY210820]|uniref:response regulator n=1 Tax=unclassified Moraxella TaxID=2685852 RepID=UPI002730F9BF|nr:response regulator [Moraxella sp. ZY210820]WLF83894.1 response regulator [Moraxella sp. ZY210820]